MMPSRPEPSSPLQQLQHESTADDVAMRPQEQAATADAAAAAHDVLVVDGLYVRVTGTNQVTRDVGIEAFVQHPTRCGFGPMPRADAEQSWVDLCHQAGVPPDASHMALAAYVPAMRMLLDERPSVADEFS